MSATATKPPLRSPLPDLARHPAVLLIAIVIPQIILLVLNLRAYHLISGEVTDVQRNTAYALFAGELTLLIGGSLFAGWLWRRGARIAWAWNWTIIVPHIAFLGVVAINIHDIIPASLRVWIVQPNSLVFHQFVLLMPAIFHSALSLACFPSRIHKGADIGLGIIVTMAVPGFWYVASMTNFYIYLPQFAIIIMVIGSSMIALTGFLRVLTMLFTWASSEGTIRQMILVAVVACIAPIAGLVVNSMTPFPADFQSWQIYALTVVNGILLLIPSGNHPGWNRALWLMQCALFPFTLYFFFVFLPFLPLAAVAVILAGAGFLIVTPTAVFIIHIRRIAQGIKHGQPIWLAALMISAMPLYMCAEARFDRAVMHHAIDYVFSPDFEQDRFHGSRFAVKRSLGRLRDTKDGRYMPFLTEFYNAMVFDGLVLNDTKMQTMHRAFFGAEIEDLGESELGDIWGRNSGRSAGERSLSAPPPQSAILENVTSTTQPEGTGTRTLLKLELHNPTKQQSEYVTTIRVPAGVFVSAYYLDVEGERVPGQIFERKTAMWIYRMIRDATRRDPGLLVYTGPNTLELRVFPFAPNEHRVTEIEFLAAPGIAADIDLDGRIVAADSPPTSGAGITVAPAGEHAQLVTIDEKALATLPMVTREPYLHFIVDRSAGATEPDEIIATLQLIAEKFPGIEECAITAANYEFGEVTDGTVPIDSLADFRDNPDWLRARGTLLQDRAIQRVLAQSRRQLLLKTPIIVVVRDSDIEAIGSAKLADFATTTPDIDHFYVWGSDDTLTARDFNGKLLSGTQPSAPKPVHLLKAGNFVAAIASDAKTASVLLPAGDVLAYDPSANGFTPITAVTPLASNTRLAAAAKTWALSSLLTWNPSRSAELLPDLVEVSRETGILAPATAYIVVENSAQWKMLKRKEKEKLKGNHALDFMESPAPSVWIIALLFLLGMTWRNRASIRKHFGARSPVW